MVWKNITPDYIKHNQQKALTHYRLDAIAQHLFTEWLQNAPLTRYRYSARSHYKSYLTHW